MRSPPWDRVEGLWLRPRGFLATRIISHEHPTYTCLSVQGNCSDPGAVAALNLTSDEAHLLLPLKPRQCLLLLPHSFLISYGGNFWLDNLYLRLATPRSVAAPYFISAGPPRLPPDLPGTIPAQIYITNVTMDAHLWEIAGVHSDPNGNPGRLLVQGVPVELALLVGYFATGETIHDSIWSAFPYDNNQ